MQIFCNRYLPSADELIVPLLTTKADDILFFTILLKKKKRE